MTKKVLSVKCPTCGERFNYYDSEFRPFCSERCKLIDLGHWLDGDYAIPSEEKINGEDNEDEE
ncbi:MAG: hypothetical protein A2X86_07815 [Bdellovibrionales bacterium GWA2_49_15]|nr:MAG: hypothetical protein A2X86_07815 [Bdellovibrionales bacterium GWA2_49_15]HAZ11815.1 DNA gyrase inhibitor YacG [Bdellovibrionales bacterium]